MIFARFFSFVLLCLTSIASAAPESNHHFLSKSDVANLRRQLYAKRVGQLQAAPEARGARGARGALKSRGDRSLAMGMGMGMRMGMGMGMGMGMRMGMRMGMGMMRPPITPPFFAPFASFPTFPVPFPTAPFPTFPFPTFPTPTFPTPPFPTPNPPVPPPVTDGCRLLTTIEEFSFPQATISVAPNGDPLAVGTRYVWETSVNLDPNGIPINDSVFTGECIRTETSVGEAFGAGVCKFVLFDSAGNQLEFGGTLETDVGGLLVVTGGSGELAGFIGQVDVLPQGVADGADIFEDVTAYSADASLGLISCPNPMPLAA